MIGTFGMRPKGTMSARALPMAEALADRGHTVTIVVPPWDFPADGGRRETVGGVDIVYLRVPKTVPGLSAQQMSLDMLRTLRRLRPTILHCFKPKGIGGLAAQAWRRLRQANLVSGRIVVDSDDWEGAGGWNDVEPYSFAQRKLFAWQERSLLKNADAVTVASKALAGMVRALERRTDPVYVPNGVSAVKAPNPTESAADPVPHPTILLYTRFAEFEPTRAVDVFARVHSKLPESRLVVVGAGLRGEESRFRRAVLDRNLSSAVNEMGWVEFEELEPIFSAATCAMFPFDDNLINRTKSSRKLLDLLAAGVPVVAEAVGQNAVVIEDGISGLLVAPEDGAALAARMMDLHEQPHLRARLAAGARRRIEDHYTWKRLVEEVELAYFG